MQIDIPDSLAAQLAALLQQANGAPAAPVAYPAVVLVDGVRMTLNAALNPAYLPTLQARVLGSHGGTVGDPSNGDGSAAKPWRSAAGFPLTYVTAGDGSLIGTPGVCQEDHTFNSDAEVLDYIRRTTLTPAQEAARQAAWADLYAGAPSPGHGKGRGHGKQHNET